MTLLVTAQEVEQMIDMSTCIELMETVFIEEANGKAVNHPRQRYTVPKQVPPNTPAWWTNMIGGASESAGFAALRVDSGIVRELVVDTKRRMEWDYPDGRSWGFVLLFDLSSGKPVVIFQDFSLSPIRVAATNAVASKRLARPGARTLTLLGSGNEAERHIEALLLVHDLTEISVYSPNKSHLETFVERMTTRHNVELKIVTNLQQSIAKADVIVCATNSSEPVFDGRWLTKGQLVISIVNTDHNTIRTEVDATTFKRSNRIILTSIDTALSNNQVELLNLIDEKSVSWDQISELGKVLSGASIGRSSSDDLIYYKNNCGVGIQFAAVGALIHSACANGGYGTEIPTELFGADITSWLDRGFKPSP